MVTNAIRRLIYFDSRSLSWVNKWLPWFLVEIDLDNGLLEAIDVVNIGATLLGNLLIYGGSHFGAIFAGKPDI